MRNFSFLGPKLICAIFSFKISAFDILDGLEGETLNYDLNTIVSGEPINSWAWVGVRAYREHSFNAGAENYGHANPGNFGDYLEYQEDLLLPHIRLLLL